MSWATVLAPPKRHVAPAEVPLICRVPGAAPRLRPPTPSGLCFLPARCPRLFFRTLPGRGFLKLKRQLTISCFTFDFTHQLLVPARSLLVGGFGDFNLAVNSLLSQAQGGKFPHQGVSMGGALDFKVPRISVSFIKCTLCRAGIFTGCAAELAQFGSACGLRQHDLLAVFSHRFNGCRQYC